MRPNRETISPQLYWRLLAHIDWGGLRRLRQGEPSSPLGDVERREITFTPLLFELWLGV
jgi:hypothetical protein